MFTDPREKLPSDGERVQFKVTGDPAITGVTEPTLGRFISPTINLLHTPGFLGTFVDEKTNHGYCVWQQNEFEVSSWRPIQEFLNELH